MMVYIYNHKSAFDIEIFLLTTKVGDQPLETFCLRKPCK